MNSTRRRLERLSRQAQWHAARPWHNIPKVWGPNASVGYIEMHSICAGGPLRDMTCSYYLRYWLAESGGWGPWEVVTKEEWVRAERAAGFYNHWAPTRELRESEPGTDAFGKMSSLPGDVSVQGRIVYNTATVDENCTVTMSVGTAEDLPPISGKVYVSDQPLSLSKR